MTAFAELLAAPGVEEIVELRGPFGFMAYHGGALEAIDRRDRRRAAAEAARCVATTASASPTACGGTSRRRSIRPGRVRRARVRSSTTSTSSITIHGFGRRGLFGSLLLGGGNRALAEHVGAHAPARAPGLRHRHRPRAHPPDLRGLHPDNPVNLPPGAGCRSSCRRGSVARARCGGTGRARASTPHTRALVDALVDTAAHMAWRTDPTRSATAGSDWRTVLRGRGGR